MIHREVMVVLEDGKINNNKIELNKMILLFNYNVVKYEFKKQFE